MRVFLCRRVPRSTRSGLAAPTPPVTEAIVVRASDRHRQSPSYLHSPAIFSSRLLTRLKETELQFRLGARISLCKIKKKLAHPTRFERVTFAFGGQTSRLPTAGQRFPPIARIGG